MATQLKSYDKPARKESLSWNILAGNQKWGRLRLVLLGFILLALVTGSLMAKGSLRYLIAPIAACVAAFLAAVLYLRDIYEVDSFGQVAEYLFASCFGFSYPSLNVYGGKKVVKEGIENMLDVIGGPGYVLVQPGNAVLFEGQNAPAEIRPAGRHFVPRYQRIQPIALEEQYGEIEESSAMSRDGFDIHIKHTRFSFRLAADQVVRSRDNPYPYSTEAIKDMIYNRTFSDDEKGSWSAGVESEIRKVLIGYINKNTLDRLTAPTEEGADPRGEIKQELYSPSVTKKLLKRGAELLWIDIGSFEIPNKMVEEQRLSNWQAKWMGDARVARSFGEAQRLAYQEIGRAEAQAEMLISIMHSLADVNLKAGNETLRDVVLVRTAQLLQTMGEVGANGATNNPPGNGEGKKGKDK
jgi:hypothetical protein